MASHVTKMYIVSRIVPNYKNSQVFFMKQTLYSLYKIVLNIKKCIIIENLKE